MRKGHAHIVVPFTPELIKEFSEFIVWNQIHPEDVAEVDFELLSDHLYSFSLSHLTSLYNKHLDNTEVSKVIMKHIKESIQNEKVKFDSEDWWNLFKGKSWDFISAFSKDLGYTFNQWRGMLGEVLQYAVFEHVYSKDHDTITNLIRLGANPNARCNGDLILNVASRKGDIKFLELLLNHGAEINNFDREGNTALINAAYNNHLEAVELLIKRGADPTATNNGGHVAKSVLDHAGFTDLDKQKEIREMLFLAEAKWAINNKSYFGT